ncbi:hypothetical protein R5R35_012866 [Gryllus longicercus]|uniref:Organic cation transporter protein n=1 Tax=Gryllus longicercus TaxID=2509291 RepID=A0AAN9VZJ0_9ORTH
MEYEITDRVAIDADVLLEQAGGRGRYQLLLVALYSVVNVLCAFHYFGQTFITLVPPHRCRLPEVCDAAAEERWRYNVPGDAAACWRFDLNLSGVEPPSDGERESWPRRECDTGWTYDRPHGYETIVSELDWVCAEQWRLALGQSLFFAGSVAGTLALGVLSDRVGRLPALLVAHACALLGDLVTAFVHDLTGFGAARTVAGLATDANFFMMYIIVMEYLSPELRTTGLNLTIGVFYTAGCVAVPWLALWLGSWRRLMLAVAAAHALLPAYWALVPESARWLLQRGRVDAALRCFRRVAHCNGRRLDPDAQRRFQEAATASKLYRKPPSGSLVGLFKTPNLRRKTCILIFKTMVLTLCYDVLSRHVSGMGINPFVMFSASSATVLPSCLLVILLQDRVGRKALASASLLLTGVFAAVTGAVLGAAESDSDVGPGAAWLAICGRLALNVAYNSGVQYSAELVPTEVRGQGVAAMHVVGYAATFFSPYVLYLGHFWRPFPDVTLGALTVLGAGLCLLLPETLGRALPVTLQDGELFGEDEGPCDFAFATSCRCCRRRRRRRPDAQEDPAEGAPSPAKTPL